MVKMRGVKFTVKLKCKDFGGGFPVLLSICVFLLAGPAASPFLFLPPAHPSTLFCFPPGNLWSPHSLTLFWLFPHLQFLSFTFFAPWSIFNFPFSCVLLFLVPLFALLHHVEVNWGMESSIMLAGGCLATLKRVTEISQHSLMRTQ